MLIRTITRGTSVWCAQPTYSEDITVLFAGHWDRAGGKLVTCSTTPPALPPAPTRPLTAPVKRLETNGTVLYTTPSDACAVNANSAMQATVDWRSALALARPIQKAPDEICVCELAWIRIHHKRYIYLSAVCTGTVYIMANRRPQGQAAVLSMFTAARKQRSASAHH